MISGSLKILTFMIAGLASSAAQDLSVTAQPMRGAITPADPFILRVTFNAQAKAREFARRLRGLNFPI